MIIQITIRLSFRYLVAWLCGNTQICLSGRHFDSVDPVREEFGYIGCLDCRQYHALPALLPVSRRGHALRLCQFQRVNNA